MSNNSFWSTPSGQWFLNQEPNYNAQYQAPNQLVQNQIPNQYALDFNNLLAYLDSNVNVQHQAPNQLVQHQMPNANVPYQAPNPQTKEQRYKSYSCSEPNCVESRRTLSILKNHMRNAHEKEMDPSLIKCVFPKAKAVTPIMCTHCQKSCRSHQYLELHFKSALHVKNLMLLRLVPLDTWDLVSKDKQVLKQLDMTDSDTALKSLLELVERLRDQKPTPDCIIIKSEPQ